MKKEAFEKNIKFHPASNGKNKNGHVGPVRIEFNLIGKKGHVSFRFLTNWHLPNISDQLRAAYDPVMNDHHWQCRPMGFYMEYVQYAGRQKTGIISKNLSENVYGELLKTGENGVWKALIVFYKEHVNAIISAPKKAKKIRGKK